MEGTGGMCPSLENRWSFLFGLTTLSLVPPHAPLLQFRPSSPVLPKSTSSQRHPESSTFVLAVRLASSFPSHTVSFLRSF